MAYMKLLEVRIHPFPGDTENGSICRHMNEKRGKNIYFLTSPGSSNPKVMDPGPENVLRQHVSEAQQR